MNGNTVPGWFAIMLSLLLLVGLIRAAEADDVPSRTASATRHEVIVQIGGRMCEYHRSDVQQALGRFPEIQAVEFLNQHGTVLVRYQSGSTQPEAFADAVERVLAMGWGCKAWVDRGG